MSNVSKETLDAAYGSETNDLLGIRAPRRKDSKSERNLRIAGLLEKVRAKQAAMFRTCGLMAPDGQGGCTYNCMSNSMA